MFYKPYDLGSCPESKRLTGDSKSYLMSNTGSDIFRVRRNFIKCNDDLRNLAEKGENMDFGEFGNVGGITTLLQRVRSF